MGHKSMNRLTRTVCAALGALLLATALTGFGQDTIPISPGGQTVHILLGRSIVVNTQAPIKRVLVSNSTVISAFGASPTQVVLEAKAAGESSLILWDQSGKSRMFDVIVDIDVSPLRNAIEQAYPQGRIQVAGDGARVILSGTVLDQHTADDLGKMATGFSTQVVNSLMVDPPHQRQILLEVKFAEVDRTKLNQFGLNFLSTGAGNTIGTTSTQQFGPISGAGGGPFQLTDIAGPGAPKAAGGTTTFGLSNLLNIFLFRPDIHLGALISDLQQKNVLQILAAPNLLALDGQKASFLAGGEFPFPVVQGGVNVGAVTIQFRPFGVQLNFTGYIEPNNVVRLAIDPEVSTLDFTNALTISGFTIPAISTRRADTEIELRDGQSFGIAGLLDQRMQAELSKIPGISEIPILGQLFHSHQINPTRTELLVLVTPYIVDPVRTGAAAPPLPAPPLPFLNKRNYDQALPGADSGAAKPAPSGKQK